MFCKFCGRQIDRNTMQCVNCKKKVSSLEGGVGFWDLADGNQPREVHHEMPMVHVKMEKNIEQLINRQEFLGKKITALYAAVAGC